jgi:hypothetical protein
MFIILISNINTIHLYLYFHGEKWHDSKYSKYSSPKHSSYVVCKYTIHFYLNIYQIRNCRVSNINKHRPTKMYLSQFLITSAETS